MQTHNTDIASLSVCPSVILLYTCTIKTTERFPVNFCHRKIANHSSFLPLISVMKSDVVSPKEVIKKTVLFLANNSQYLGNTERQRYDGLISQIQSALSNHTTLNDLEDHLSCSNFKTSVNQIHGNVAFGCS